MKLTKLSIEGLILIEPRVFEDPRGYFSKVSIKTNLMKPLANTFNLFKTTNQNQIKG